MTKKRKAEPVHKQNKRDSIIFHLTYIFYGIKNLIN